MLNFSKSSSEDKDLQNRTTVHQRVLCDWLRNISNQNIQIARRLTVLQKSVDLILENEGRADSMAEEYNADNSDTRSVS